MNLENCLLLSTCVLVIGFNPVTQLRVPRGRVLGWACWAHLFHMVPIYIHFKSKTPTEVGGKPKNLPLPRCILARSLARPRCLRKMQLWMMKSQWSKGLGFLRILEPQRPFLLVSALVNSPPIFPAGFLKGE